MIEKRVHKFLWNVSRCFHNVSVYRHEYALLSMKKKSWSKIKFSFEQKKEIQSVYNKYTNLKWHRLYQAYSGVFHEDYFPEVLFSTRLAPMFCPKNLITALQDKSMLDILYGGIPNLKLPKTVVVNCSGIYYDGKRNVINREMAISYVEHWSKSADFVIKPLNASPKEKKLNICKADLGLSNDKIAVIFDKYQENFIIQERIINFNEQELFQKDSINTLQVMTYILDGRLYHTPILLGFGKKYKEAKDENENSQADKLFIYVKDDGVLNNEAVSESGKRYTVQPGSNLLYKDGVLPNINKLIEHAYACHKRTPHIRFITWEFTIDQNSNPVLLDTFMCGQTVWLIQAVSGEAVFGNNTKRILELMNYKRSNRLY